MSGRRCIAPGLLALSLLSCSGARGEPPAASPPPAPRARILLLAQEHPRVFRVDPVILAELAKEGITVSSHASLADLTPALLDRHHVVVLYQHRLAPRPTKAVRQGLAELRAYARRGGGLLITKDLYSRRGRAFYQTLLAPMGAEVLHEQLADSGTSYQLRGLRRAAGLFAWTGAITAGHPVTRGVEGLFYSVGRWEPGEPGSLPLRVDDKWTVLVRGRKQATTHLVRPTVHDPRRDRGKAGSYAASPPLLAVRSLGKGRVALWPTLASFTLLDGYSEALEGGLVMRSKRGDRVSHGARLTYNLLRWLGQGARPPTAKERLPRPIAIHPLPPLPMPMAWTGKGVAPPKPTGARAFKGLIGARSRLSVGTAEPRAMIAAARKAGYDFIAFAEELSALDEQEWGRLVAACREATNSRFAAIPGMHYRGILGDPFIVLGPIGYPPTSWADPGRPGRKIPDNRLLRMASEQVPPVIMLPLPGNRRPAREHVAFYGYALQVWQGDKLLADDRATYLALQREAFGLFATAVHLVDSPGQVAAAASQGMQAWVRAAAPAGVLAAIQGFKRTKAGYASSGPEITTLAARNWGTADLARPGRDRLELRVRVRAPAGLAEVRIMDGPRLMRRFLPDGEREFSLRMAAHHDRQRVFVVQARDRTGGEAVSWSRWTNAQELHVGRPRDNCNDLGPIGKVSLDRGGANLRGTEAVARMVQPAKTPYLPALAARGLDGQVVRLPGPPTAPRRILLAGRFGAVLEYDLGQIWQGKVERKQGPARPITPNPAYGGTVRRIIYPRLQPGPVLEVREYDLTVRQDLKLARSPGLALLHSGNAKTLAGELDRFAVPDNAGGRRLVRPKPGGGRWVSRIALPVGQYAAAFPMLSALFPLDQPLLAFLRRDSSRSTFTLFSAGLGQRGETLARGSRQRARFALLTLPRAATGEYTWLPDHRKNWTSHQLAEQVHRALGLAGKPAYTMETKVGKVLSTRLVLGLAAEGGGFRARLSKVALPLPLPVWIQGLNPRWSAGVWYQGEARLLRVQWPPGWSKGRPAHRRFVVDHTERDPVLPMGVMADGAAMAQIDPRGHPRDIFIGNLVRCDHPEVHLTLVRPAGQGRPRVDVHNPTDKTLEVTVRPGQGFDLYGAFALKVKVGPGSTVRGTVGVEVPR